VDTDLGHDAFRRAPIDPGDGVEQLDLRGERGDQPVDLRRQLRDGLVQEVLPLTQLGQDPLHDESVVGDEATLEGPAQLGTLVPEGAPGQLGQDLGIAGP
jgi:hypothetical protein